MNTSNKSFVQQYLFFLFDGSTYPIVDNPFELVIIS